MFNANVSNISAISWREEIVLLTLDTYKTFRNKTYCLLFRYLHFQFVKNMKLNVFESYKL